MTLDLEERARIFATAAHTAIGQMRKYSGKPYIVHPARVAAQVRMWGGDENQIAAAWLHDTVEDTHITLDDIKREFGDDTANLVNGLTDISTSEDGIRVIRKAIDRKHSASSDARTQFIKCADIFDNTESIVREDPFKFAIVYLKEMRLLIDQLTAVDRTIWNIVNTQNISCCIELDITI